MVVALWLLASWGLAGRAQVVTWSGLALGYRYTDNPANWQGGTLPLNNGTEQFIFGPSAQSIVWFGTPMNANKVSITGIISPFLLDDDDYDLNLGSGGLVYAPALPVNSLIGAYPGVVLLADQTWDIQSGELGFLYSNAVYGAGRLIKTGAGALNIAPRFSWTGGVTLNEGRLVIDANNSSSWTLGSGNLIFGPPPGGVIPSPTIVNRSRTGNDLPTTITNPVDLNGILAAENDVKLTLSGLVTLNTDSTINSRGAPLFFDGKITNGPVSSPAARKLTIDGIGLVVLNTLVGTPNDYSGGTHVANGLVVFANGDAVPDLGLITIASSGYAGYGDILGNEQTQFLNRLDPLNVHGAIGFDSDPILSLPTTFSTPIILTGFAADARLGSATRAILGSAAVITPQGTDYRFGGGGGVLQVGSQLTNAPGPVTRNVIVDSPVRHPLTIRLTNAANNFTGTVSATHSALIFDPGAMPAGTNNFLLGTGGYIGTSTNITPDAAGDAFISSYLAHFPASTNGGVIGFDGPYGTLGTIISNNLSLAGFAAGTYLGTSSPGYTNDGIVAGITFTGTITPAGGAGAPFRFAAYNGGLLQINSPLTGTGGAVIGDPLSPATFGNFLKLTYSTVFLNGNNSALSGNVQLYGGQLIVGQGSGVSGTDPSTALGTGTLVVQPFVFPPGFADPDGETPPSQLAASDYGMIIDRPIQLNTELSIGLSDTSSNFALTGQITGPGELYLDNVTLRLANGTNTFSGGIYIGTNSQLMVGANNATGLGPLLFGNTSSVYFGTAGPVVYGLDSQDGDYTYFKFAQNDSILTVNQATNGTFRGEFRADTVANPTHNDSIRLVKNGTGTLRLEQGGLYFYNAPIEATLPGAPKVSLQINQGTVEIGPNFYIEGSAPTIWVNGGTLAVVNNSYAVVNPIVVDNAGRLAGTGDFGTATIGIGGIVAPGGVDAYSLGRLSFNDLTLAPGGIYEWSLNNATIGAGNAWDMIDVTNLPVTATSGNPFTIKLRTVALDGAAALASGFDASQAYSWEIISTLNTPNFDPTKFVIDTSLFANSLAYNAQGNGAFSLSLGGSGGQNLLLNFTPVPEPSAFVLMALGLGGMLLPVLRRRARRS